MKNRLIPGAAALVALGLTVVSVIAPTAADARPRDPRVRCGFDNDDPQCEETSGGSKRNEKGEYEVEIIDGKNPPKNIPWSTIVTIKSPFETYKADVIGRTADLDVALLKLDQSPKGGVKPLAMCVRRDAPVGTDIVVVGNPMGFRATTTRGIVSAVRNEEGAAILQIDAPVNPGNSGGPIVNYNGEVVGIVTSKLVAMNVEGIGFGVSIPSALESLGVEIKSQTLMPNTKLSACGNLIL